LRRGLYRRGKRHAAAAAAAAPPSLVRVTVAIPTRDRLALLAEAVASVQAQNISGWELIIVDDGSTDGTWDWLASIQDPRIRALRADPPGERSAARNRALAAARATYVLFLDDDDRLAPGALRSLLRGALKAPEAGAVIGRRVLFDDSGHRRRVRHVRRARTCWAWREVMLGWAGGVGATLWATSAVRAADGWDERLSVAEDQDLLLRVAARSPLRMIPRVTLEQRLHPAQQRPGSATQTERQVRQEFLSGLARRRHRTGRRLLESWEATRAGQQAMANRDYGRAVRCYARAIRVCPAQLIWPLVGPRLAAQGAKAATGRILGRTAATVAAAARTRARVLLRRAPGEYRAGPPAPPEDAAGRSEVAAPGQRPTGMTGLRTLLPSSLANLTTQGVLVALGLFTGIVTARVLGPAGRGELALIVLVPAIGTIAGSLGIEYGTYYLWHTSGGRLRPHLLAAAAAVTAISGTVFGTAGFIIIRLLEPQAGARLGLLAAAGVPLSIANAVLTMALMAQHRVTAYNLSRLAGPVVYAVAVAGLWRAGTLGVASAVLAWFASLLVTVTIDIVLVARSAGGRPLWDARVTRRSAGYGLRSYVGTLAQYGTLRLDQVLLVALAGNGALGLYYAAVSLGEFVLQIANNIGSAMMAKLGGRPRDDQRRLALTTVILVGLSATGAAALLMAYGADVITLLLGRAYLPGLPALRILLPGSVLLAVARILNGYFIAVGEAQVFARASLASLAVTIVGSVALIPRYHASGAAIASTVAYAVMLAWLARTFRAAGPRRLAGASEPNRRPARPAQDLTQ
ncbi:MAG: glycosyltransferase, partial [Streptosporangiaceae bacterium]